MTLEPPLRLTPSHLYHNTAFLERFSPAVRAGASDAPEPEFGQRTGQSAVHRRRSEDAGLDTAHKPGAHGFHLRSDAWNGVIPLSR